VRQCDGRTSAVTSLSFPQTPLPPRQQATVGLTLATAFRMNNMHAHDDTDVRRAGSTDDPAIQFLTSGQTSHLSILANTTQTQIGFQTGTVSGTLSFATTCRAGTNLPTSASASILTSATSSDKLRRCQKDSQSGFAVLITSYSTNQRNYTVKFSIQHAKHTAQLWIWYPALLRFGIDNDF